MSSCVRSLLDRSSVDRDNSRNDRVVLTSSIARSLPSSDNRCALYGSVVCGKSLDIFYGCRAKIMISISEELYLQRRKNRPIWENVL
jgi:hypothetical protein